MRYGGLPRRHGYSLTLLFLCAWTNYCRGISPRLFTKIECARDKRRRKFRFRYDNNRQVLCITLPTALHVRLYIDIYEGFRDQLVKSGRQDTWLSMGACTYRAQHSGSGEGDFTGGPKEARDGSEAWPTLVVLAGDPKPLIELHNDVLWWFSASEHAVKIIVLAKFERAHRAIILEKWEEEESIPGRPGATVTRSAAALRPVL